MRPVDVGCHIDRYLLGNSVAHPVADLIASQLAVTVRVSPTKKCLGIESASVAPATRSIVVGYCLTPVVRPRLRSDALLPKLIAVHVEFHCAGLAKKGVDVVSI